MNQSKQIQLHFPADGRVAPFLTLSTLPWVSRWGNSFHHPLNSIYTSATMPPAWGALGTPSSREGVKLAGFVSFPALRSTSPSHIWLLWPQILPLDVITAAQPVGLDSPRFSFPLPTAFPLAGPSPEQCHRGDCVTPGRAGSVYN